MLILQITLLLLVANGAPLLGNRLWGPGRPLDAGIHLPDGRPLLGASKTGGGVLAALAVTPLAGLLLGVGVLAGLVVAAAAMAGDLLSSFIKRRMGLRASARAPFLDQLPEGLLPAVTLQWLLGLGWIPVLAAGVLFVAVDMLLSPLLYRWGLRRVPY